VRRPRAGAPNRGGGRRATGATAGQRFEARQRHRRRASRTPWGADGRTQGPRPVHPRHVRDERLAPANDERQGPAEDDRRRQRPQPAVPEDRREAVRMAGGEERLQRLLPGVDAEQRRGRERPQHGETSASLAVGLAAVPCTRQPREPAAGAERRRQHDERRQRMQVAVPVRGQLA
jgi:hypothetical protein